MKTCTDKNFIFTYQSLRVGQWNRVYNDANSCAAAGYTLSEYGHKGAQLVAAAKGVPIPNDLLKLSRGVHDRHIDMSCNVLFPNSVNHNQIVRIRTNDGDPMYSSRRDANSSRRKIKDL